MRSTLSSSHHTAHNDPAHLRSKSVKQRRPTPATALVRIRSPTRPRRIHPLPFQLFQPIQLRRLELSLAQQHLNYA